MQENFEFTELEKSLSRLKQLTEKMTTTLENANHMITENINTGVGIWDSEMAGLYRSKWDVLLNEVPDILKTFQQQETNLEHFIENMKKVEEH